MSFLTQLDRSSHPTVQALIKQCLLGHVNATSLLKQPLPMPQDPGQFFNFEGFWVAMGNKEPEESPEYVLTDSVKANLKDLCRVVSARYAVFSTKFKQNASFKGLLLFIYNKLKKIPESCPMTFTVSLDCICLDVKPKNFKITMCIR